MLETLYIVDNIKKWHLEKPNNSALICDGVTLSYENLYLKIRKYSSVIANTIKGSINNVNVLMICPPTIETVITYFAVQECGAIPLLVDNNAKIDDIKEKYEEYDIKLLITNKSVDGCNQLLYKDLEEQSDLCDGIDGIKHNPNDIESIIFTSGTTSKSRGVMIPYKAVYQNVINSSESNNNECDSTYICPSPLHHIMALSVIRYRLFMGGTVVIEAHPSFAKCLIDDINKYNCKAAIIAPSYYELLKKQIGLDGIKIAFGNFNYLKFASGYLNVKQRKEVVSILPNVRIFSVWGASEISNAIQADINEVAFNDDISETLGKPIKYSEIKIVDDNGNEVKGDKEHPGRISVRTDSRMIGYYKHPELTEKVILNDYVVINDIVYRDNNGYYYMLGRSDDMINIGGEKLAPIEMENYISKCNYIKECAVIGVDDPKGILGQIPIIFLVHDSNFSKDEFKIYLQRKYDLIRIPREFISMDELPKNNIGKIDRNKLKEIWNLR